MTMAKYDIMQTAPRHSHLGQIAIRSSQWRH